MILILSGRGDRSVEMVTPKLVERGAEFLWWDPGDYPAESRITSRLTGGSWRHTLHTGGRDYDTSLFSAVWNRRPSRSRAPDSVTDADHRKYVEKISRILVYGWEDTVDSRWFPGRTMDIVRFQNKLFNLAAAARLGFATPETLITNDVEELIPFWEAAQGELIAKEVEFAEFQIDGEDHAFYSTPVTRRHLTDRHRLAVSPAILQPYIRKSIELRITIVGEQVFAAEIHSQASRATRHDYRHHEWSFSVYGVHRLPDDVERRCLALTASLGLPYGCIDMILTPEGRYVFLEINPTGQWGWIEAATGLPISAAIADWLVAAEPRLPPRPQVTIP
ncbi:ATP-dependent carboxylate-amine ligase [Planotetraspora sp. A-T 1434]|uniref:MvdC/MvdD family ATP grasp protein n=1 Tax=Planotetraspora sp. A-T 1434 TaxID=2979219 RepID=UPI0021BF4F9B|nr:ATP-dependent carboxylate-amine ligase [Planotetraspora sp. A-T 1434]MCT9933775.1 ATP-dependent carboxylate-amine ligase [Planotetraspora sp. A-T 1434]